MGGSSAAIFSASRAFIADHFADPLRSQHLGNVISVGVIGSLSGSPLVGWLFVAASNLDMSLRTTVALAPILIVVLFAYIAVRSIRVEPSMAPSPAKDAGETLFMVGNPFNVIRQFLGVFQSMGPQAWLLVTMLMTTFGAQNALLCATGVELKARGHSASTMAGVSVPSQIVSLFASPIAGRLAGQPGNQKPLSMWSLAIFAGGLFAAPVAARMLEPTWLPVVLMVCLAVSQFASSLLESPAASAMVDLAAAKSVGNGRALMASEFGVSLGDMVGPYCGSAILRSMGFEALCHVIGGMLVLSAGLCAMFWRSQGEKTKSS